MSKLSVIIPLLKSTEYLEQCIESISDQNVQTLDVVIVRDFEDSAVEEQINILKQRYAHKFSILQLYCNQGQGLSAMRNFAMFSVKSEYVFFMEPEDILEKGTIQGLLDKVPNLPVPMVYTRVKPLNSLISGYHEEYEEELQLLYELDNSKLSQRPTIDQTDAVYEASAVDYMIGMRDNLEDFSVFGCMFYRNFLKENDIVFSSELEIYPDAPFICKVLVHAEKTERAEEGAYVRRSGVYRYAHEKNYDWQSRLSDYMTCYDLSYSYCTSNLEMMLLVQETMCSRYINYVVRLLYKSKDAYFSQQIYDIFSKQMKRVDKRVLASFDSADRNHLKLLFKGDLKESIGYMDTFIKRKKRSLFFKKKMNFMRTISEKLFGNMDIMERCILFESGNGNRYYGDPKYIYKYLQENYPGEYKCVWVANSRELADRIDGKCAKVKQYSLRYFYYILRAKYWVKDTRQPVWWYKAPDQVYISTWLGSPMQKLFLDKQAFLDGDAAVKRGLKAQVDQWDVVISSNAYCTEKLQSGLGVKKPQILEIGNPRNDIFYGDDVKGRMEKLKLEKGLPINKKTILYAPVWREKEMPNAEGYLQLQLGLYRMKEQLGSQYVVLLRLHKDIVSHVMLDKALQGFVYDFSFYDDVQELLLLSDIMVTDYSSMVFDYACLNRPIYFYLYDLHEYRKDQNHFYFDFDSDDLPGPVCQTTQEIIDMVQEPYQWKNQYQSKLDRFRDLYCAKQGGSAERLARAMFAEMEDLFEYEDEEKEAVAAKAKEQKEQQESLEKLAQMVKEQEAKEAEEEAKKAEEEAQKAAPTVGDHLEEDLDESDDASVDVSSASSSEGILNELENETAVSDVEKDDEES